MFGQEWCLKAPILTNTWRFKLEVWRRSRFGDSQAGLAGLVRPPCAEVRAGSSSARQTPSPGWPSPGPSPAKRPRSGLQADRARHVGRPPIEDARASLRKRIQGWSQQAHLLRCAPSPSAQPDDNCHDAHAPSLDGGGLLPDGVTKRRAPELGEVLARGGGDGATLELLAAREGLFFSAPVRCKPCNWRPKVAPIARPRHAPPDHTYEGAPLQRPARMADKFRSPESCPKRASCVSG